MNTVTFPSKNIGAAIAQALSNGFTKPLRIERKNGIWRVTVAA